jgi:uncharacterized membrane protein YcaP (DUF421 family)
MEARAQSLLELLGPGPGSTELDAPEMALRAAIVYLTTIIMVRVGQRRFMGRGAAFDMILGIVLGSVVSRAITGNAPFLPTLGAAATLVCLHWLFAVIAFRSHAFGVLIKGREIPLLKHGEIQWAGMRKSHITERDLLESLRTSGNVGEVHEVEEAWLERSGKVSVVPKCEPRVVEVSVRDGVQTVRIEISD